MIQQLKSPPSGSWNPQCSRSGSIHGNSLLLLLDVAPQVRPTSSAWTSIWLYLMPRGSQTAKGYLSVLYCDKVEPRLLTPAAQVPASPDGLLRSSPGGCRMPAVTQVGRTSCGWVNFEAEAATGHPAHSSQMQCSDFPLSGHKNVGGQGRDRNWGKTILSPAAKLLSSQSPSLKGL